MRELRTEIEINAPPEVVWKVLSDFASYPGWNPFVRSIKGKMAKGEKIEVFLQPPKGKGMTVNPEVLEASKNKEFRWLGHLGGVNFLFNGEHSFKLQGLPGNSTRLFHGEKFSGILVPLLWKNLNNDTKAGFIEFNMAIKKRSEKMDS